MLNVVYFGTPDISAAILKRLVSELKNVVIVTHVITQPDKPVGRKQVLTPSHVKVVATELGLPVIDMLDTHVEEILKTTDLVIVFAYGAMISESFLQLPKHGFWNIHPSLLPLFRGSSPIVFPMMLGLTKTGVSLMQMDSLMDHGPILTQKEVSIDPIESKDSLTTKLLDCAFSQLEDSISKLAAGTMLKPVEQDHSQATNTRLIKKEHGFIARETLSKMLANTPLVEEELPRLLYDYLTRHNIEKDEYIAQSSGHILWNYYRALTPWPGIWTLIERDGKEIRLILRDLDFMPEGSSVQIKTVQVEGRTPVTYDTFIESYGGI